MSEEKFYICGEDFCNICGDCLECYDCGGGCVTLRDDYGVLPEEVEVDG
jgi:hypothetical protein